jgi:hypothetical protein
MQAHYYRTFAFRQLSDFTLMILLLSVAENDFQSNPYGNQCSCNVPFWSGKFLSAVWPKILPEIPT